MKDVRGQIQILLWKTSRTPGSTLVPNTAIDDGISRKYLYSPFPKPFISISRISTPYTLIEMYFD